MRSRILQRFLVACVAFIWFVPSPSYATEPPAWFQQPVLLQDTPTNHVLQTSQLRYQEAITYSRTRSALRLGTRKQPFSLPPGVLASMVMWVVGAGMSVINLVPLLGNSFLPNKSPLLTLRAWGGVGVALGGLGLLGNFGSLALLTMGPIAAMNAIIWLVSIVLNLATLIAGALNLSRAAKKSRSTPNYISIVPLMPVTSHGQAQSGFTVRCRF